MHGDSSRVGRVLCELVLELHGKDGGLDEEVLSRHEVSARQDAMTYLVRVRELLSGW